MHGLPERQSVSLPEASRLKKVSASWLVCTVVFQTQNQAAAEEQLTWHDGESTP